MQELRGRLESLGSDLLVLDERDVAEAYATPADRRRLVYLSPDAPSFLDVSAGPRAAITAADVAATAPAAGGGAAAAPGAADAGVVFVVGGLVDRKVKRGRSLRRAQEAGLHSARLPLPEEAVSGAGCPLNIDTVLSLLHLWCQLDRQRGATTTAARDPGGTTGGAPPHAPADYLEAWRLASAQHRARHPNQGAHCLGQAELPATAAAGAAAPQVQGGSAPRAAFLPQLADLRQAVAQREDRTKGEEGVLGRLCLGDWSRTANILYPRWFRSSERGRGLGPHCHGAG